MSITLQTALEIFSQPNDLHIYIVQPDGDNKYAFAIERGPGHNFKPLISSSAAFDSPEAAIKEIKAILEACCKAAEKEVTTPTALFAKILNPENRPLKEMTIVTKEKIELIVKDLEENHVAKCYSQEPIKN